MKLKKSLYTLVSMVFGTLIIIGTDPQMIINQLQLFL